MAKRIVDLGIVVLLVAYAMAMISWLWREPLLLTFLLVFPPLVLATRLGDYKKAAIFAATALVLGPLTESICVANGLWTYHETAGLPWVPPWIFPLWTCFPAALWIIVRSLLNSESQSQARPLHLLLLAGALALEIVLFIRFGHSTPLALMAVTPLAIAVLLLSRRLATVVIFLAGGVIGPLCESLPIYFNAWHYQTPELLGMPAWLPVGYAVFGVIVGLSAEQLAALRLGSAESTGAAELAVD